MCSICDRREVTRICLGEHEGTTYSIPTCDWCSFIPELRDAGERFTKKYMARSILDKRFGEVDIPEYDPDNPDTSRPIGVIDFENGEPVIGYLD